MCLSFHFDGVYLVQVVMEYLVIAFVPCDIINMLYGIKRYKIYMWALKCFNNISVWKQWKQIKSK